jgi:H2-forming N5,N10-methylenetetrahydromethanopterin dehydrogenase-like enzyme
MNEQRQQAYFNLIQQLLNCPHGEEGKILQANAELVDEELVQVMEQVATMMEQQGEGNPAWLRSVAAGLSQHIQRSQSPTSREDYLAFLQEVLQAISESNNDPQVVYPVLQQHLDKLDDNFAQILQQWARNLFKEGDAETGTALAAVIANLCIDIKNFPFGNRATNLEIAITGHETVLEIYTRDAFPNEWATTQNNLGVAYSDRIRGRRGRI